MKLLGLIFGLGVFAISATTHARIDVMPSWVDFGQLEVGQSRGSSVQLWNRDSTPVHNIQVSTYGDTNQFSIQNSCFYLAAYQSCYVHIFYQPQDSGRHQVHMSVYSSDGGYESISITGSAVERN